MPGVTNRAESWVITDHVCRYCCGRVLKRRVTPRLSYVICAKCGKREKSTEASALCFCGVDVGHHGKIFECVKNPNPRSELPNQILVLEKSVVMKAPEPKMDRHVACPEDYSR